MKFEIITKKRKELKELNTKLKEIEKELKKEIKEKSKNGKKIDEKVINSLKRLLLSIESTSSLNILDDNKYHIFNTIPTDDDNCISLYNSIINIIRIKLKDNKYDASFDCEDNCTIFDCLYKIEDIKNKYNTGISNRVNLLLSIIKNDRNDLKIGTALNLLYDLDRINDSVLETLLVETILKINNEYKVEQLYHLINIVTQRPNKYKNECVTLILKYINELKKDKKYDKNLERIIHIILNKELIDSLVKDYSILYYILETNLNNYNNENMNTLINFFENTHITKDNKDLVIMIMDEILQMKFTNEEHEKLCLKVINDIVLKTNNIDIIKYYLNKLKEVKNIKSLNMLIDIYPFINKYSKPNEEEVFNQICDVEENKTKKLVIPITEE